MNQLNWTGMRIRELRQRLGWSQAELARRLGCRQQTVSEWETNTYQPQNAYSKLLDSIFDQIPETNHHLRVAPLAEAAMKGMNVSQVSANDVDDFTKSSFDLGID